MKYYAVKNGKIPGIYTSWNECKEQVSGYSGAVYKSFTSKAAALEYIGADGGADTSSSTDTRAWAYVDGSYVQKRYSYGMIVFDGEVEHEMYEAFDDAEMAAMRNVAGEITGSMSAVRFCLERKIESITIYYDYEGIERWANGEWKTNKEGTRRYAQFIKEARENMRIVFKKVKGHSGDKYNDRADALAKKALGIK
jgi:ribonuclease HI